MMRKLSVRQAPEMACRLDAPSLTSKRELVMPCTTMQIPPCILFERMFDIYFDGLSGITTPAGLARGRRLLHHCNFGFLPRFMLRGWGAKTYIRQHACQELDAAAIGLTMNR